MHWQFTPFIIPLLLSTVVSGYLAYLVWHRRPAPGARTFTLILLVAAVWTAGYSIELVAADPSTKLFWSNVNFFATVFMPTAWLVFAIEYTGKKPRLDWLDFALLSILPLITLVLVWTSQSNHILFSGYELETTRLYSAINRLENTLYWIFSTYYYLLIIAGTLLIFWDVLASPRALWGQKLTLLIGVAIPTMANALALFGLGPFPALDLTPFGFTFFSLAVFWSLFGFRLFDLIPVARTAVIESMGDGLIVLDTRNRIADLNQAAADMLAAPSKELIGKQIAEIHFPWPDQILSPDEIPESRKELMIGKGDNCRYYDLHISSIYNQQGEYAGRLVVLHDVQERKQVEEELRSHERYLTQLNNITHTTLEPLDFQDMLRELASRLGELVSADGCQVVLWDEASQRVLPKADFDPLGTAYPNQVTLPGELTLGESVIQAGCSLVVEDVFHSHYLTSEAAARSPERSILGVPLNANDRKLGAVLFNFHQPHHFTPQEIALCEQAAGQVALAIAKTHALDVARRRAQEAETLQQASTALTSALDLRQTLDTILVQLERVIPYDSACIFLLDGDEIQGEAVRGILDPNQILGQRFPADDVLLLEAQKTGAPIILPDAQADPRYKHWGKTDYVRGWMGVPLIEHGVVRGYLTLDSRKVDAFSKEQGGLVLAFANQAAVAIEHARLYMAERQRVRELDALHNATVALLGTLDIEKLLNHILAAALSAIPGAEMGTLTLVDPATGKLQVRSTMGYTETRVLNYTFLSGEGYSVTAVPQGKPLLIRDTQEEGSFSPTVELPGLRAVRSAIIVPLVLEERVTGVISLDATRPNVFIDDDLRLLVSFAATATAAIHNAQLHAEVQQLAITDSLTGLYNLRGLFELGRREVERARRFGRPLSGIMLDIDHFKRVNDSWGHATGNQVLAFLGESCRMNVRDIDIAARYGGEEFAVLLPETDTESALQIAERLRSYVANTPAPTDRGLLPITISLGVAGVTETTLDLANLLNCADAALYAAKQAGRNCVRVNS